MEIECQSKARRIRMTEERRFVIVTGQSGPRPKQAMLHD
jgi:hypothetical protein